MVSGTQKTLKKLQRWGKSYSWICYQGVLRDTERKTKTWKSDADCILRGSKEWKEAVERKEEKKH